MSAAYSLPPDAGKRLWFLGTTMVLKAGADQTNNSLTLVEQACPPDFRTPLHVHEAEDEAFYVLEGELEVTAGEERWQVGAGGFSWLPRGIPHAFRVTSGPARLLQLTTPGEFDRFAELAGREAGPGDAPPPSQEEISRMLEVAPDFRIRILG